MSEKENKEYDEFEQKALTLLKEVRDVMGNYDVNVQVVSINSLILNTMEIMDKNIKEGNIDKETAAEVKRYFSATLEEYDFQ